MLSEGPPSPACLVSGSRDPESAARAPSTNSALLGPSKGPVWSPRSDVSPRPPGEKREPVGPSPLRSGGPSGSLGPSTSNSSQYLDSSSGAGGPSALRVTESQHTAIVFPPTPNTLLCIRAGPGSGKTHTLVNRIAYLVSRDLVQPHEVLVLSMANRSVKSLRASLVRAVGEPVANRIQLSTFHSFCGLMLEQYGPRFGPKFARRLMDDASWRAFATIFSRKSIRVGGVSIEGDISAANLHRMLAAVKSGHLSVERAHKKYGVSRRYIEALLAYVDANGMGMYSDIISDYLEMVRLAAASGAPIEALAHYKVVVVDEFQDMYPELLRVVASVAGPLKHLTIAGDPNQSIYEFLGSTPGLMRNVERHLPGYAVTTVELREVFRSTPQIVSAASAISFAAASAGPVVRPAGHKPVVVAHASPEEEHFFIAREVTRLICASGGLLTPSDFAVLTRTNLELAQVERLLTGYSIQCNKLASTAMWTHSRVSLFINVLLVLQNHHGANFALLCILQVLDPQGSRRTSQLFNATDSIEAYLADPASAHLFKRAPATLKRVRDFLGAIGRARETLASAQSPTLLLEVLLEICERAHLLPYLNQQPDLAVCLESFGQSLEYHYAHCPDGCFLDYFVRNYGDHIPIVDRDSVNLSTIHAAKGLEFAVVFITGATKLFGSASWDSLLSGGSAKRLETARLFYVASTRAKHLLYIGALQRPAPHAAAYLSSTLPQMGDSTGGATLLERLSDDLQRAMPSQRRLARGKTIFNQFRQEYRPWARSMHTWRVAAALVRRL
ncbi:DNA 3'-5' helicase [[Candida] zeylanoides]